MKFGSIEIISILDGELPGDPGFIYPDVSAAELSRHEDRLDPISGAFLLAHGGFLIRTGEHLALLDLGVGPASTYPNAGGALRSALVQVGVEPEDITDIIFSHLHYDHLGWLSLDGKPVFPNATVHCDRRDWEMFVSPTGTPSRHTYGLMAENDTPQAKFAPYPEESISFWKAGGEEILPGIRTRDAVGHTPGTVVFEISSEGEEGMILGDVAHTIAELLEGWSFIVHEDNEAALKALKDLRDELAERGIPCVATHFRGMRWGRVVRSGDRYEWLDVHEH